MRERGVCLALVLAAGVAEPNVLTDEILQTCQNLPAWVAQAKQMYTRLLHVTDHKAGGGRNPRSKTRSRSRSRGSRGRASGGANMEPQPRNLTKQELVVENEDLRAQVKELRKKLDHIAEICS